MKTRTINKVIPEETIPESIEKITEYCCDECEFFSTYEEEVEEHYAINHACKATKKIWDDNYFYFKSKDDLYKFAKFYKEDYYDGHDCFWKGEGWYISSVETRPCGRGCCTRNTLVFKYIDDTFILNREESIREDTEELQEIKELLKEKY